MSGAEPAAAAAIAPELMGSAAALEGLGAAGGMGAMEASLFPATAGMGMGMVGPGAAAESMLFPATAGFGMGMGSALPMGSAGLGLRDAMQMGQAGMNMANGQQRRPQQAPMMAGGFSQQPTGRALPFSQISPYNPQAINRR